MCVRASLLTCVCVLFPHLHRIRVFFLDLLGRFALFIANEVFVFGLSALSILTAIFSSINLGQSFSIVSFRNLFRSFRWRHSRNNTAKCMHMRPQHAVGELIDMYAPNISAVAIRCTNFRLDTTNFERDLFHFTRCHDKQKPTWPRSTHPRETKYIFSRKSRDEDKENPARFSVHPLRHHGPHAIILHHGLTLLYAAGCRAALTFDFASEAHTQENIFKWKKYQINSGVWFLIKFIREAGKLGNWHRTNNFQKRKSRN